jgi:hypothetical protein
LVGWAPDADEDDDDEEKDRRRLSLEVERLFDRPDFASLSALTTFEGPFVCSDPLAAFGTSLE